MLRLQIVVHRTCMLWLTQVKLLNLLLFLLLLNKVVALLHDVVSLLFRSLLVDPSRGQIDFFQFVSHKVVVRLVCVLQGLDVLEYFVNLRELFCKTWKQIFLRLLKCLLLQVSNLIFVRILLPTQWFIKKLQNYEEKAPQIVFPTQFFLEMSTETSVGNCASEIGVFPLGMRFSSIHVEVFLSQTKIH